MSEQTLKPCPFCGDLPVKIVYRQGDLDFYAYTCIHKEGVQIREVSTILCDSVQEAASAWDARTAPPKEKE